MPGVKVVRLGVYEPTHRSWRVYICDNCGQSERVRHGCGRVPNPCPQCNAVFEGEPVSLVVIPDGQQPAATCPHQSTDLTQCCALGCNVADAGKGQPQGDAVGRLREHVTGAAKALRLSGDYGRAELLEAALAALETEVAERGEERVVEWDRTCGAIGSYRLDGQPTDAGCIALAVCPNPDGRFAFTTRRVKQEPERVPGPWILASRLVACAACWTVWSNRETSCRRQMCPVYAKPWGDPVRLGER